MLSPIMVATLPMVSTLTILEIRTQYMNPKKFDRTTPMLSHKAPRATLPRLNLVERNSGWAIVKTFLKIQRDSTPKFSLTLTF